MKKVLLLMLIVYPVFAQGESPAGMLFLKHGYGARNLALGDLGVVVADDVTALAYNPAIIPLLSKSYANLSYNALLFDASTYMIGGNTELWGIPLAFGINSTSIKDIEIRTAPGEPSAFFDAHYFYATLSSGVIVAENISAGLSFKYLYESIFFDNSTGYAFDLGVYYKNFIPNLNLAASVRNLGEMNALRYQPTKLPSDLSLGAAYNMDVESFNSTLIFAGGFQRYLVEKNNHFRFGTEIKYNKFLSLRLGYVTGIESKNISYGLGIYWENAYFDYAFVPFKYNLGSNSSISFSYSF